MDYILEKLERLEAIIQKHYVLSKDFLTLEEAAEYMQLSKSALYKLTSSKKIPYYVPGGKIIYFRRIELDEWLIFNRIASTEEITNEVDRYLNRNLKS